MRPRIPSQPSPVAFPVTAELNTKVSHPSNTSGNLPTVVGVPLVSGVAVEMIGAPGWRIEATTDVPGTSIGGAVGFSGVGVVIAR